MHKVYCAVTPGHAHVVRILLQAGADVNITDTRRMTPEDRAKELQHNAIVQDFEDMRLYRHYLRKQNLLPLWSWHYWCWNKLGYNQQALVLRKRGQALAFLMAKHARLGAHSHARNLDPASFQYICQLLIPSNSFDEIHRIAEEERKKPQTWLKVRSAIWYDF